MSGNTRRFSGRVQAYERYRQRYPAEAVLERLRDWCGLTPAWRVADVGAGTGMLSEVFLENGNDVVAVEPNAEMREVCEGLRSRWPGLRVVEATAEATELEDGSVEMVAAGRAFHWFDEERALAEFRRVLAPEGWVVLVSVGRATEPDAQSAAMERVFVEFGTDFAYVRGGHRTHERME
ncbi:MAG TPA: class I SAM-dependent methyltransferase, partial [Acidobacteriaceae bacterium]|nr:class I SAM-dependent methyltransferase [Acidobacteriaceae bacterium]